MNEETAGLSVFRPFGLTREHMDVDFGQPCRPRLVTQLLRSCAPGIPEDDLWALPVSRRIEALLHIALPGGNDGIALQLHCPGDACGEAMEVELSREEIFGMRSPAEEAVREPGKSVESEARANTRFAPTNASGVNVGANLVFARYSRPPGEEPSESSIRITVNGAGFFFRRPTGNDQLKWLEASFPDEETARAALIRTLCLDPDYPLTPPWIVAVDEAMRDADPLVYFTLTVACPACEEENVFPVDLESLLIRRLQNAQKALLDTVHRLASRYHWSEAQILDVPPHRRTYYLERIDNGE